jgi:hypothetical protein
MAKISEYDAATAVVPTASVPLYDPTAGTKDQRITESLMANIPSVVKVTADQATITVGTETANVRAISVQLKNADGTNLTRAAVVRLIVFTTAAATALSIGGSTGLAIGANGMILNTEVAKKIFLCKTDETGLLALTWTDTGSDPAFLGVVLPDGRLTMSAAMTNAP